MKETLLQHGWHHAGHEGLIRHLGGLWHKQQPEGEAIGFIAEEFHANRNGLVHGGMMMTVVDRAFGIAARQASGAQRSATVNLSHQFLAPLKIGTFAVILPRVVKVTSRMVFMEGTLTAEGEPVLQAQGLWRVFHSA